MSARPALNTAIALALFSVPTPVLATGSGRASSLRLTTVGIPPGHSPFAFAAPASASLAARRQEPQHCRQAGMPAGRRGYQIPRVFSGHLRGRKTPGALRGSSEGASTDLLSVSCSSGVAVGAFLVVFWPVLLPLALLVNLRLAACAALAFVQLNLYVPKSTKLLALGVVGNVLSLRFLRFFAARQLAVLKNILRHPVSLALSFPPALLLTPVVRGVARSGIMTGLLSRAAPDGGGSEAAEENACTDTARVFSEGQVYQILDEVSARTDASRAEILAWTRVPNRELISRLADARRRNTQLAAKAMAARLADARGVMEDKKHGAEVAAKDLAARMAVAKSAMRDGIKDRRQSMEERMKDSRHDAQTAAMAMFAKFDAFRTGVEQEEDVPRGGGGRKGGKGGEAGDGGRV